MAKNRVQPTLGDYLTIALSPVLIMGLVGSLAFFLLEVFYQGDYGLRLRWILFLYVFATVLIGRIAIVEGNERATAYGVALAGAVCPVVWVFVDEFVLAWLLLAVVWWCANKLTWDCTLIDEQEDVSGEGLLQAMGLDAGEGAAGDNARGGGVGGGGVGGAARDDGRPGWRRFLDRLFGRERKKKTPGAWVIFFSLAALPMFGLGQLLIPAHEEAKRTFAFWMLCDYIACALGLLVTTSFLGLRRYLRQRQIQMPVEMARIWISVGALLILAFLIFGGLLPRPGAEYSLADVVDGMGSPDQSASQYAVLDDSPVEDDEGGSSEDGDSSDGDSENQGEGEESSDEASGDGAKGDEASEQSGLGGKPGERPGERNSPGEQAPATSKEGGSTASGKQPEQASEKTGGQKSGGGKPGGQNSSGQNSSGQNSSGQNSSGQNSNNQDSSGQKSGEQTSKESSSQSGQKGESSSDQGNSNSRNANDPSQGNSSQSQSSKSNESESNSSQREGKSPDGNSPKEQGDSKNPNSGQQPPSSEQKNSSGKNESPDNQKSNIEKPPPDSRASDPKANDSKASDAKNEDKAADRNSARDANAKNRPKTGNRSNSKSSGSKSGKRSAKGGSKAPGPSSKSSAGKLWKIQGFSSSAIVKWIVYAIIALAILYALVFHGKTIWKWIASVIEELKNLWASLFATKPRRETEAVASVAPALPPKPFSEFSDPFMLGIAGRYPPAELVRYSFEALEAWANDRGEGRSSETTPLEFSSRLQETHPEMSIQLRDFASLYGRLAFSPPPPPADYVKTVEKLWRRMTNATPAAAVGAKG